MDIICLRLIMAGLLSKIWIVSKQTWKLEMVKSFKEIQKQEAAFDTRDRGIREVPMDRIVGSVGRYNDFDQKFRSGTHLRP